MAKKQVEPCTLCGTPLEDGICTKEYLHIGVEEDFEELESASESVIALEDKLLRANRAKATAQIETRATKRALADAHEELEAAYLALSLYDQKVKVTPEWLLKDDGAKNLGTLVSFFSDSHYGEVVNPAEVGYYNSYNMDIAEKRTERFFHNNIKVARNYLHGVEYEGIVLALNGDLVSGDIHEELVETNELSTYDTIVEARPWLKKGIEMYAEEFGKVHVVSAPGNHGRNTAKPRHKKRSANNADTHLAKLLMGDFKEEADITFDVPESADVDFSAYGFVFTMEHGDNLKFAGTAEIGAIGPVKRGTMRRTSKRQQQGRPFDYFLVSHFHQFVPAYTQGFIMNGSLKGYDEYASNGQFKPEIAQQALIVVTPEYGITGVFPIFCQKREAEGW